MVDIDEAVEATATREMKIVKPTWPTDLYVEGNVIERLIEQAKLQLEAPQEEQGNLTEKLTEGVEEITEYPVNKPLSPNREYKKRRKEAVTSALIQWERE